MAIIQSGGTNQRQSFTSDWSTTSSTDGAVQVQFRNAFVQPTRPGSRTGPCNESDAHSNEEKAFYHGLKSAYRMSRRFDGEYGTKDRPPYETAARIAANVALAYFEATGEEYTREESREYLGERFEPDAGMAAPFSEAIGQAWTQVEDKWKHYDAARTALAAAESFLDETFEVAS